MRLRIATHVSWFLLPAVQFSVRQQGLQIYWPWMLVLWWGNRGIQLEGSPDQEGVGHDS